MISIDMYGIKFNLIEDGEAYKVYKSKCIVDDLKHWLSTDEAKNDINYSDIYKDVYGHRP